MDLQGKVALITGASEGIGAACVSEFRRRGAQVSAVARNAGKLAAVGADLAVPADLTTTEGRSRAVDETLSRFGRVDILVNNAGLGVSAPAWKADLNDVRYMFELNVFAPLELTQRVVPSMRASGGGYVVNVGSVAGKVTMPWFTLYSSTKYALGSMTQGLRMELHRDNIQTMIVCPGFVRTDFRHHVRGGPPPGQLQGSRPTEISAEECARAIANGIERNAKTLVVPRIAWLMVAAARLFPNLVDSLLIRTLEPQS